MKFYQRLDRLQLSYENIMADILKAPKEKEAHLQSLVWKLEKYLDEAKQDLQNLNKTKT